MTKLILSFILIATVITNSLGQTTRRAAFGTRVIPGDFADPSVIFVKGVYYAVGTSSEWAPHFPIFTSTNLIEWKQIGYAFAKKPIWTTSSFWAPELYYHQGKFILYYVARKASDNTSCIGVAVADDPTKGFTDRGILVETGKEAIDPFIYKDGSKLYISWKAYGLDDRPIELLATTLSKDGLKVTGKSFTLLKDNKRVGLEGQCIVKHDNYYYLFYSVGNCCGSACSYYVNVARSTSFTGVFEEFSGNPILKEDDEWKCPGHGTMVMANNQQWYYLYHAYNKYDNVYTGRQGMLSAVDWKSGWPVIKKPALSNPAPTPVVEDDFNSEFANYWQWDFRHAAPEVHAEKGQLCLTGKIDSSTNKTGTVLTVRPFAGDYVMTVTVVNNSKSFKGLSVYGDAGQSVGIGTNGDVIQSWFVDKNTRKILSEVPFPSGKEQVNLKITATGGNKLKFYWSEEMDWKELTNGSSYFNADFLPPWDRSPRPGIYHQGNASETACFTKFKMTYR